MWLTVCLALPSGKTVCGERLFWLTELAQASRFFLTVGRGSYLKENQGSFPTGKGGRGPVVTATWSPSGEATEEPEQPADDWCCVWNVSLPFLRDMDSGLPDPQRPSGNPGRRAVGALEGPPVSPAVETLPGGFEDTVGGSEGEPASPQMYQNLGKNPVLELSEDPTPTLE